jgi:transglutaminase-like putative cysteine protease
MTSAPDRAALKLANIFWLLAAVVFVVAPHTERLPIWVTLFCLGAGAWRGMIAWHGWRTPHWAVMVLLTGVAVATTFFAHGRLYGRDASSTLLIVMLCLKILEMRSRRDALLVVQLGFFLVFTNFLYSQTFAMGAYMLLCVWLFIGTLVGFNRTGNEPTIRERLMPAALMVLQAIPLMVVIFILFPRATTPLWRLPQDANTGMTGLSDSMSPGDLNNLIQQEKVAFRADFAGRIPGNQQLYWRGPVLWDFDGRTWRMPRYSGIWPRDSEWAQGKSPPIDYFVTLEPHGKTWMFALDMPTELPRDAMLQGDYQLRSQTPINSLKRYQIKSALTYRTALAMDKVTRKRLTALPPGSNPRAAAFAAKLREDFADDRTLILNTLRMFNAQFVYTLEPPILGAQPVDEFLFDHKRGFCEHYASAFVFLMRSAGIPSRVVTGYQGGEINTLGNYLIVRQADAHAWAEVWLPEEGWVRFDPTAAVAPDRIERGMDLAMGPVGVIPNLIAADKFGVLRQMRFAWDAFNNEWNQWVIGYGADRQQYFLSQFGIDGADWRKIAIWLVIGVLLAGGGVSAVLLWRARDKRGDPASRAYAVFTNKLAKAGLQRSMHEGPVDFLRRVEAEKPSHFDAAAQITELYISLRYGFAGGDQAKLRALRRSVRFFSA